MGGFEAGTLLMCLLSMYTIQSVGQVIDKPPKNATTLLHHDAEFVCVTRRGATHWSVNGTDLPSDLHPDLVTDSTSLTGFDIFTLTVPGRAEYNGTRVQCVTEGGGDSVGSSIVTLEIQGRLSSVGDLKTERYVLWINISWTAPFSLNVTDVDPDVWFSVLIYNVTDKDNPTAVPCNDCINITETYYIFTTEHPSPCHKYNFTIIPYNGVGQGERNKTITATFPADDTKECNFQGSDVTVPECTVPSTNKSDEETGRNLTPLWVVIAGIGALGVLGVALHVAGGTAAICCHCRKAKQYASFNANLNANGVVNRNQSKMVTTQQQEAQPLLKVGNGVDEQKVKSDPRMESAADSPEGLTKKQVVFSPVRDRKDPEQCTVTVHTSTSANDTSKTFKKLDDSVLTVKDCTSPASSVNPHEQSISELHQIAASRVVTREEENRQQTEQVTSTNKLTRPRPESSAAREHGQESFAKKASMEQVYKMSQSGTSSPVPPQTYDYQKSLPPLPHREHTAIPMDDTTEKAPHRSHPPASHSGSMEEVHPVTDASPLPRSQSMPCIL